ncbi:hemerythrin superfamily protein [Arthrobacter sp. CAN_A214]|uniref:hemerythrin domain-containing protein n=1 Tax=Arthrobacter sp. CAN_A214 TaxID=2787720 RepID=UPI0018C93E55
MYPSVAHQTVAELGGPTSVLVRQKNDHVKLNALLKELEGSRGAEQGDVLRRIYRLVFPHAFAEEAVLWPVVRRVLPDGEQLTLEVEQEHQEVNELVTRLETLEEGDPERERVLDRLVEVLGEDVRDEEDKLFPRLQEVVSKRLLQLMGISWEVVRRTAPTRAHPVVARRPPGNAVAAVPLSLIDRIRDAVDTAILQRPKAVSPVLHRTSTLLARVAHSIEHLPLLTRGEDPTTSRVGRRSDGSGRRRPPVAGVVAVAAGGAVAGELVFRSLTRRTRR